MIKLPKKKAPGFGTPRIGGILTARGAIFNTAIKRYFLSILSKPSSNKPPGGLVRRAEMQKAGRNRPLVHNYAGCSQWTRIEVYISSGGSLKPIG